MDENNPANLLASISHYRQMLRMGDDPALCEALAVLISRTQEKLLNTAVSLQVANPAIPANPCTPSSPATLGDVLYAKCKAPVPERDWESLVRSMAAGDEFSLQALYARAHAVVLSYARRITDSDEAAEALTTHVFDDLWQHASHYDPGNSTVIGWIMNQTRAQRADRQRSEAVDSAHVLRHGHLTDSVALIGQETEAETELPAHFQRWSEPEWEGVAPGIQCKLLATDAQRHRVSMLVRLAPGGSYPAHTHAGTEELYLLDGELWIDERKLVPGDYNYGAPGTGDERVWSETGCTCVLVTSTKDRLR